MIRNINGTNKNTPSKDEIDKKFIEATERFTQKLENGFFNDREFTDQEFDDMLKGVQEALEKDPQKDVDAIVEQQLNSKQNEEEKEKTLDLLSSQSDERRKEAVNLIERANSSGVIEEIGVSIDDYKNNFKKSIEEDKAKGNTRDWMNFLSSLTREDLAKEEHESALANAESPYDVFGNNCVVDDEAPSLEEISQTVKKQRELELKYENTDASI